MKKILFIAISILLFSCKQENVKMESEKIEPLTIKKYCFVKSFSKAERNFAIVDFIEFVKKSEVGSGNFQIIELPDEYCYINREVKYEEFEFADTVKIIMQKFSYDDEGNFRFNQSINLAELLNEVTNIPNAPFLRSPYEIVLVGDKITILKEIYIP